MKREHEGQIHENRFLIAKMYDCLIKQMEDNVYKNKTQIQT